MSVLEGTPLKLDLARALAEHGSALRRIGRIAQARERLSRAHDLAGECGALALARTVRDELARTGATPGRDDQQATGRLTPTEWAVAELAVEGLTNRAIAARIGITQRTVEVHLTSTYRKLGVSRRIQLPQALAGARTAPS